MFNRVQKSRSGNGGGGLTPEEINALIELQIAEFADGMASTGRDGWVSGPLLNLSGVSILDMTGVPSDANHVDIALHGVSTTGASSMYARVFNASGVLLQTPYNGHLSNLAGSALSSVPENPGDAAIVAGGLLAPNFAYGSIVLGRHGADTWRITASVFDASARRIESNHVTSTVGAGITGVRLLLGSAGVTWDAGTALMRWRR